ncbi:hypothetical protein EGW08_021292 [Elysia chlorotica]|uniref:Arrestin-like N-terminal domain-containing protein n=1 Tax=Elysia chlorotica TaxID=188477 RepID=A0A433SNZ5_ELYCH|nr:hypothetical protein EGW08_021292 [Elysia chlorotica]
MVPLTLLWLAHLRCLLGQSAGLTVEIKDKVRLGEIINVDVFYQQRFLNTKCFLKLIVNRRPLSDCQIPFKRGKTIENPDSTRMARLETRFLQLEVPTEPHY